MKEQELLEAVKDKGLIRVEHIFKGKSTTTEWVTFDMIEKGMAYFSTNNWANDFYKIPVENIKKIY